VENILIGKGSFVLQNRVSIPLRDAVRLCKTYRSIHTVSFPPQCKSCLDNVARLAVAEEEKAKHMCLYNPPFHDGCSIVNRHYKQYMKNREDVCCS
jgi:hypothetical protein